MKAKLIGAVVVLIVVGLALFGWVGYRLFTTGFSAKTEPHALEVLMARQIRSRNGTQRILFRQVLRC